MIKITKINDAKKLSEIKNRNIEIEEWFAKNKTADFLILDDDKTLNELPENLKDRWIQIDAMYGITKSIKDRILEKYEI